MAKKLTKPELIEELTKLGVEFDAEAKATDLAELLKANLPPADEDDADDEDEDEEETAGGISFRLKDGNVRTFTKEIHGKDFKKVAAEFAETHKDKIVKKS